MCQVVLCCLVLFRVIWYHSCMGKYNGFTDARKRANNKYLNKFDTIALRIPKGKKAVISDAAAKEGLTLNQFIIRLLEDKLHVSLHDESS